MINLAHVQSGRGAKGVLNSPMGVSLGGKGFQIFLMELCVCIEYIKLVEACSDGEGILFK